MHGRQTFFDRCGLGWYTSTYTPKLCILALLCTMVVCHDLYRTFEDKLRRIEEAQQHVSNVALAVQQQAEEAFSLINGSLGLLIKQVEADGISSRQRGYLQELMQQQVTHIPMLESLFAVDASGEVIARIGPNEIESNILQSNYLSYHRNNSAHQPYINTLLDLRGTDDSVVVVSRRVDHPDGSFGGIFLATIKMRYFKEFYSSIDLGRDGVLALFRDDTTNLVREPPIDGIIGTRLKYPAPFTHPYTQSPKGVFEGQSPVDGVQRIFAWRWIPNFPLIVLVGLGANEQLAGWRLSATEHLFVVLCMTTLLGTIGAGLIHQVRRLSESQEIAATATKTADLLAAEYRLLADNTSDMVILVDLQFRRRFVSCASRDLLGYEPNELIGGTPRDLVHPDDAERFVTCLHAVAAGRKQDRISYRARRRDGNWIWVDVSLSLVLNPVTGMPDSICCAVRDISEQVEVSFALRQSEERLRLVLQSNAITEALYLLDPDGVIESWNAGAERIMGYAPEEIIGQNFRIFFTREAITNGDPAKALALAAERGTVAFEAWRVRKDGAQFIAEVVIDSIFNMDGTLRGFVKVTRDTTDRRIEEEQRRIITESAPNGIIIVDERGVITLANSQAEKIFDYQVGTLKGERLGVVFPDFHHNGHAEMHSMFIDIQNEHSMPAARHFVGRKRDGNIVPVEVFFSPVSTPRGKIVVTALFDVTERTRALAEQQANELRERERAAEHTAVLERLMRQLANAKERAERANRTKSRFLASMSHELRTPLTGILGYTHLLELEGALSPTQLAHVDAMKRAGKHLQEMITCILDMAQIETDQVTLRPTEINLSSIAGACLDLVRPMAQDKGLILGATMAPDMPITLIADPIRLRQILLNLLGNAVKFTSKGSVRLNMRPAGNASMVRIEVADTGPGVKAEQQDRLFKEFERLDIGSDRIIEGAGLGLALSSRLAKLMGGRLEYEENPGGGSIFGLELPLNLKAALSDHRTGASALVSAPTRVCNVLVVDDMLMNRDIARSFLRLGGHTVTCVASGVEAIEAALDADFDVILMDVAMPGMDGLEATRRIRALGAGRAATPIVGMTAHAFTDEIAACHAAGMDSHLAKPFDPETLLATVRQAVSAGRNTDGAPQVAVLNDAVPAEGAEAEPAIRNKATFAQTTSYLPPETAVSYLRTLLALGDDILTLLRSTDVFASGSTDLAERVHTLSGSASMFGFERLSAAGLRFERVLRTEPAKVMPLTLELAAVLEPTLEEIRSLNETAVLT